MIKLPEKDIIKACRIVFKHGYQLGNFSQSSKDFEKGFDMMINHLLTPELHNDEVKRIFDILVEHNRG